MMLAHQMNLENSPHLVVPDPAVLDLLYSQSPEHFELYLKKVDDEGVSSEHKLILTRIVTAVFRVHLAPHHHSVMMG